jgi:hypothetical protein
MSHIEKAVFFSKLHLLLNYPEKCDRIYFGQEFCQRLMPNHEAVKKASEYAKNGGTAFTLVTPFVTNAGLQIVRTAVAVSVEILGHNFEIVVNDWGVLNFLHREYGNIPLVLGRLLTKQKRGPQLLTIQNKLPETALDHFRRANCDVRHVMEFLQDMGIVRVELDNLLQGITRSHAGLPASLYYPYGYITTTRLCLLMRGDKSDKNFRSIGICECECDKYDVALTHGDMPVPLILKGNTQFFKNDKIPADLTSLNISRLVFEPSIPI